MRPPLDFSFYDDSGEIDLTYPITIERPATGDTKIYWDRENTIERQNPPLLEASADVGDVFFPGLYELDGDEYTLSDCGITQAPDAYGVTNSFSTTAPGDFVGEGIASMIWDGSNVYWTVTFTEQITTAAYIATPVDQSQYICSVEVVNNTTARVRTYRIGTGAQGAGISIKRYNATVQQ